MKKLAEQNYIVQIGKGRGARYTIKQLSNRVLGPLLSDRPTITIWGPDVCVSRAAHRLSRLKPVEIVSQGVVALFAFVLMMFDFG